MTKLKPSLSTLLVAIFTFILLFLGLFAEVLESQAPEVDLAQIYANPVPLEDLQRLKALKLTNRHGHFVFENRHPEALLEGPWQMVAPHVLRVKEETITKILDALNVLRVRNFHRLEPINISSFSLDNPTMTLLFTNDKEKDFEVKMGLINPIDNSAYLSVSTQDQIYQIEPMEIAIESWDLTQLVESRILAIHFPALEGVELSGTLNNLKIQRQQESWTDQNGNALSTAKIEKFVERLSELRSSSILENLSQDQRDSLERVMNNPVLEMRIRTETGERAYMIGELSRGGIPNMPLGPDARFVLSNEEKKSFVLINRDQLRILSVKLNELK